MRSSVNVPYSETKVLWNDVVFTGSNATQVQTINTHLFRTANVFYSLTNFPAGNTTPIVLKIYAQIAGKKFLLKDLSSADSVADVVILDKLGDVLVVELQPAVNVSVFLAFKFFA
ncbi:hypothetical protein [Caldisericum sp.]|uniref:hypothetical protein n=1 Tax=Caldisericum sp. TaxID=2499687 RepID=UPI003D0EB64E